jgi:hypothetical protein
VKFSSFTSTYSLHDTTVDEIRYIDGERRLCLKIDFMQYFHPDYKVDMPELVAGAFEIQGVTNVACNQADFPLQLGVRVDAEELSFDRVQGNTWEFIMQLYQANQSAGILTLKFEVADDAEVTFTPVRARRDHLSIT